MVFLAILAVIFIIIIIVSIIAPIKQKNDFEKELKEFLIKERTHTLIKEKNKPYDYTLILDDTKYLLKTVSIPSFALVQINNKNTWEVKYGAGEAIGKAQPYSKYLSTIQDFMKYKTKDDEIKVAILIPKAKEIVMYINECEIEFVTPNTNVYGTRIINTGDYSLFKKIEENVEK